MKRIYHALWIIYHAAWYDASIDGEDWEEADYHADRIQHHESQYDSL